MGWNTHITNLSLEADSVAVQARAIKHCEIHEHIWIDRGDPEANKTLMRSADPLAERRYGLYPRRVYGRY